MSGRRRGFMLVVAALVLLGSGVLVVQAATGPSERQAAAAVSTLYLLQSGAGTLDGKGKNLELQLFDPSATVTTFADRPARLGGSESLKGLVKNWGRTFGDDPPNAALQIDRAPRSRDIALLELGRPKLANKGQSLSFPTKRLAGTSSVGLRTFADGGDAKAGGEFSRSTLFIDDGAGAGAFDGYLATFTLNGPGGGPGEPDRTFQLVLENSVNLGGGTIETVFGPGEETAPSITTQLDNETLTMQFPPYLNQLVFTNYLAPPTSGDTVDANVVLPPYTSLQVQTEAGNVSTGQSGQLEIPATPPPK